MSLTTEYRLHFVGDKDGVAKENYISRLNFRRLRQSQELSHTPLIWLDESMDESDKTAEKDKKNNNDETCLIESGDKVSNEVITSEPVICNNIEEEPHSVNKEVQADSTILTKDVGTQSPSKKAKTKGKQRSALKPVNRKKPLEQEKPIIAYGWADRTSIQSKKTFNVKAPKTEVRLSAIRAENQRNFQRKNRLTGREKLLKEKLRQQQIIDALTHFDQWETEYKRQFSSK